MPKHLIRRYLPDPERIAKYPGLGLLGKRLADPSLWHMNRRSAAGAMFFGLWCAMLPIPGQVVLAAAIALLFRINLPLCAALVFVSNPLTIIPLGWLAYLIGSQIFGMPMLSFAELSQLFIDLASTVVQIFSDKHTPTAPLLLQEIKAFMTGAIVMGFMFACAGYLAMRVFWRWHVLSAWKKRAAKRQGSSL